MGYQAVLFCPDEKLARVVSQVFDEVDFAVDPVNDPFATVKKLMAQHYDAIVVDCESEQNSSMLFKSAHNSPLNQNSLAIALVDGQAGVAQAYRMGANLVLTKPINVEQAKGTLRVARGLLRKSADMAGAPSKMARSAPAKEAPAPPAFAAPFVAVSTPAAPLPASAPAQVEELPAILRPPAQIEAPVAALQTAQAAASASGDVAGDEAAKTRLLKPAEVPAVILAASTRPTGAAAPAPAKEAFKPAEMKPAKEEETPDRLPDPRRVEPASSEEGLSYRAGVSDGLSFAAFREHDADGAGGGKKILIVTVVLLGLAAAVYFGWGTFGGSHWSATPNPAAFVPDQQPMEARSDLAPMSHSTPGTLSTNNVNQQSSSSSFALKTSPSKNGRPSSGVSSERSPLSPEPAGKGPEPEPIRVRPDTSAAKTQVEPEATVQPPSPLAVESPDSANLKGLVDSGTNVSKPTLAQIRISQGVSNGLLIKSVPPKYPAEARASHAQGAVQIEATVDKEGNVVHPKVLSGNSVLAKAALEAVRQWRYKPYYLDGEPVEIQTQITINFKGN
jgi:TonB family protein